MGKETRLAILELARQLLRRRERLNIDKIVKTLGISKPTFYYHFRNKGELMALLGGEPPPDQPDARQRVLDAALAVFAREGYTAATLEAIAREAGLTKGAIYWHFKSKEDLLRAAISDSLAPGLRQWLADNQDQSDDELLRGLLTFLAEFCAQHAPVIQIIFMEARRFPRQVLSLYRKLVLETVATVGEMIDGRVREGAWRAVDPFTAVEVLMLPLMVRTLAEGRADVFPELAAEPGPLTATMASIFLDGVRVRN